MAESVYYRFTTEGLPENTFTVVRFTGDEAISALYCFSVDLLSEAEDLDLDELHDSPSTLTINVGDSRRIVQGVITDVELVGRPNGKMVYRIQLRPRAWELSRGSQHEVYLSVTTPDIIQQALGQSGITQADFYLEIETDQYREWEFRLQYGESYWNFLSRALERDGIYYYFTAGQDVEQIHFCDNRNHHPAISDPNLKFSSALGMDSSDVGKTVHSMVTRHSRVLRHLTLQNYNDAKPSTRINITVDVDENGAGTRHLYGQKVLDETEAKTVAEIRAEEIYAGKVLYHGESTVCLLSPAHTFSIDNPPKPSTPDQEYQVVSVRHSGHDPSAARQAGESLEGDTPTYENSFTAIPANTQYRPPQTAEEPLIHGTITARIDAEGNGQYAELDAEGRYHIVFPFDTEHQDGKASHWVRVMQPYAGEREGMHFPMRKGTRVLVGFLGGDPDLPVITGAIPDAEQYSTTNSGNQTSGAIITPSGSYLELESLEGRERVEMYATRENSLLYLGADHDKNSAEYIESGTTDSDPDADGILLETLGVHRTGHLGGSNRVTTTRSWAVTEALWPDTPDQRSQGLSANDVSAIREYTGKHWRTRHGSELIFRFPSKHTNDTHLSADQEAAGDLLITRTVGDEYTYGNGTTFQFNGPDREYFSFGPFAEFHANTHNTPASSLRELVSTSVPQFDADSDDARERYAELNKRLREIDSECAKVEEREAAFRVLDDEARRRAIQTGYADEDDETEVDIRRLFLSHDHSSLNDWLKLANYTDSATSDSDAAGILAITGVTYVGIQDMARLPTAGDDSPRDGSIKQAENLVESARAKHREKLEEFEEDDLPIWPGAVREGQISARMGDQFAWHEGRLYDFGGNASYHFGGNYNESHVDGPPSWPEIHATGHTHDLLSSSSLAGSHCKWDGKLNSRIKGALSGSDNILANKIFGDTYTYHKGTMIDVHVGSVQTLRDESERTELEYSGDTKRREFRSESTGTTEKKFDKDGTLTFYERDGYSFGHDTFTFEASYSNKMAIKFDASSAFNINMGMSKELTLSMGLRSKMTFDLAGALEMDFKAGSYTKLEMPLLNHNEFKFCAGVAIKMERSPMTLERKNGTTTLTLAGGVEFTFDQQAKVLNAPGISVKKAMLEIGNSLMQIDSKTKVNA